MTKSELNVIAREFIMALGEFRRSYPDEVTALLGVAVPLGNHPDDAGWWVIACNRQSAIPYEPGSPEWIKAGNIASGSIQPAGGD